MNTNRLIILGLLLLGLLLSMIYIVIRAYIKKVNQAHLEKTQASINHKRELLRNSSFAQEKERKRIAADIHDDLIAQLNRLRYCIEDEQKVIENIIYTARRISHDLSPQLIIELPLPILISDHIEPLKKSILFFENYSNHKVIPYDNKLQLYRIFQEITNNIIKHSKANKVTINYRSSLRWIYLSIEDNGIGLEEKLKKGLGMKNIEIRNEIINGIFDFNKRIISKGVKFRILIKNDGQYNN